MQHSPSPYPYVIFMILLGVAALVPDSALEAGLINPRRVSADADWSPARPIDPGQPVEVASVIPGP